MEQTCSCAAGRPLWLLPTWSDAPLVRALRHHACIRNARSAAHFDKLTDSPSSSNCSWAKSTIFINKPVSALLKDAGNIPVDRKNKDNQALFSGTFDALKLGEVVAIFPEGTSYTEPHLQAIKEGASWVCANPSTLVPSGAVLTSAGTVRLDSTGRPRVCQEHPRRRRHGTTRSCRQGSASHCRVYRLHPKDQLPESGSHAVRQRGLSAHGRLMRYLMRCDVLSDRSRRFGKPIPMKEYIDSFLNTPDGPKGAVKELTKEIRDQMIAMTVDAPDWCVRTSASVKRVEIGPADLPTWRVRDTLRAAETARQLLWGDDDRIPLKDFRAVSQRCVHVRPVRLDTPQR